MSEYTIQMQIKKDNSEEIRTIIIDSGTIKDPGSILDLGFRHSEQIELLQKLQDALLDAQSINLEEKLDQCPHCKGELGHRGYNKSDFHSVFTDHKVKVHRQVCKNCKWRSIPSIKSLFGTSSHPDLLKLQCETGAQHTYREAQDILNKKSYEKRKINNHDKIHSLIEKIGAYISKKKDKELKVPEAAKLVIQVDGGHLKDKDPTKRSFEAMTAVIYKPENVIQITKDKKKVINKHCVASALADNQEYMKQQVLITARNLGLTNNTEVIAISDGAENCWNISKTLENHCKSFKGILDWFHISMKFQNISLPKTQKLKLDKVKWNLWHGNLIKALELLNELILKVKKIPKLLQLKRLLAYLDANRKFLVNYKFHQDNDLVFTSNIAEATVESLINRRCKGQQHMRWTRIGAHYLLQLRACIASNIWIQDWLKFIMNTFVISKKVTI